MFDVVLDVHGDDGYVKAMNAIYDHEFGDVEGIYKHMATRTWPQIRVRFTGAKTRNTDAHAYFAKRGLTVHVEPVSN